MVVCVCVCGGGTVYLCALAFTDKMLHTDCCHKPQKALMLDQVTFKHLVHTGPDISCIISPKVH